MHTAIERPSNINRCMFVTEGFDTVNGRAPCAHCVIGVQRTWERSDRKHAECIRGHIPAHIEIFVSEC
jgi:hypothetical protein